MLESVKRTFYVIKPYFSKGTFPKMIFMLFSRSLIICGIGTLSIPVLFYYVYNNLMAHNTALVFGAAAIFSIYVFWLVWADKKQLIAYNRLFFSSEMSMQKEYIFQILGIPTDIYEKEYGISKSAALLDDGTDEVMMRFQDFVSLVFKSVAVLCVLVWIFCISNIWVVLMLLLVITMEFFVSEKISSAIGKREEDSFQCEVNFQNSQRIFIENTDVYAMENMKQYWHLNFKEQLEKVYHSQRSIIGLENLLDVVLNLLDLLIYLFIILYGLFVEKSMLSPLVIVMSYEMMKDIVIDFFNSILRIQQKVYAIKEFETINKKTTLKQSENHADICLEGVDFQVNEKKLLQDIDLEIKKGSKILIVGENGAGKTVLLKVLAGIYSGKSLEYTVTGKVQLADAAYEPVDRKFFPISIYENINLCCEKKVNGKELEERLREWISSSFSLEEEVQNYENHFSLGQMDTLGFLRILYSDKEVLLLDEPFAHVDKELKEKLWDAMMQLKKTVILVEHDYAAMAEKYNPYVVKMKNGRIIQSGMYANIVLGK